MNLTVENFNNPCTGEVITISSGNLFINVHGVYHENKSTVIVQASVDGITAKGRCGMSYTLSGSYNEQTSEFSNGVFTTRLQHFDRRAAPGSSGFATVKSTYFIKADASGNMSLYKEPVSEVYCL